MVPEHRNIVTEQTAEISDSMRTNLAIVSKVCIPVQSQVAGSYADVPYGSSRNLSPNVRWGGKIAGRAVRTSA